MRTHAQRQHIASIKRGDFRIGMWSETVDDIGNDTLARHLEAGPDAEEREEWQRRLAWMVEVTEA